MNEKTIKAIEARNEMQNKMSAPGYEFDADDITEQFSMIVDWGTFAPEVYNHKCIWKDDHPEHQQFLEVLRDPIFESKDVKLGNISSLRNKALNTA